MRGDVEQGQRRQDGDQLAAEIAPGIGPDDRLRQAVRRAALRLAQGQHPQGEQQAGNADGEEGGLPADQAERRVGRIGPGARSSG